MIFRSDTGKDNVMDVPRDKSYPPDSGQCDACGGNGCDKCDYRGWLIPKEHPGVRLCERSACGRPIPPAHVAVYCSDQCARLDA